MNCELILINDEWVWKQPPGKFLLTKKGPGIVNATMADLGIARSNGSEKFISLIFDPGSTGHIIHLSLSSNSKFCEIYAVSGNSDAYLSTSRGELNPISMYDHSYSGQKTSFSKLHLKFLSLQGNKDELTLSNISFTYTQMATLTQAKQTFDEFGESSNISATSCTEETNSGGGMISSMMGLSGGFIEQLRADMMREIAHIVEEKMQPVVSQIFSMERKLVALESQNRQILDVLTLVVSDLREMGERRAAVSSSQAGTGDLDEEVCTESASGSITAHVQIGHEDYDDEDNNDGLIVESYDRVDSDVTGADLKSDMKKLMSLLKNTDSLL